MSRFVPHTESQAYSHRLTRLDRFTLDSATKFLFDSSAHTLGAPLPYAHNSSRKQLVTEPHSSDKFARAVSQVQHQIALRSLLTGAWPLFEFWKDKTKDMMRTVYDFIDPILDEAISKKGAEGKELAKEEHDDGSETLLGHLVEQTTGELSKALMGFLNTRLRFTAIRSCDPQG
jgi:hypothetical protein